MNEVSSFSGDERLEFRQIVLGHIKHILNLSLRSNRDGEKLSLYFNSIEVLADVLIPFYDEQMNNEVEQFENELIEIQKENSAKLKALCPSDYSNQYERVYYYNKKRAHRNLFRKLNMLLKRNDYLKESVYGEDNEEVIESDERGEE